MKILLKIIIGAICLLPCTLEAKVSTKENPQLGGEIFVYDDINASDVAKVNEFVLQMKRETKNANFFVTLNSHGGSVSAGMELGRIVRKNHCIVKVPEDSVCQSSCVFILAGGESRFIYGKVGIHSPRNFIDKSDGYDIAKKKFDDMSRSIKAYLAEMNIPETLYDAMLQVSPGKMRILSEKELDNYSLSGEEPVYREKSDMEQADILGISREEYYRRQANAETLCSQQSADPYCYQRVMGYKFSKKK